MLGLLYKDYIAVKGRWFIGVLTGVFFVISAIRFTVTDDEVVDALLLAFLLVVCTCFVFMIMSFYSVSIMKTDEGKKQKQYYVSLPVSTRQYVASKYILIGVAFYIVQSVMIFLQQICSVNVVSVEVQGYMQAMQTVLLAIVSVGFVGCAIDMALFFWLGVKKANNVLNGCLFLMLFIVVAYLLFGNLSLFEKFNVITLLEIFKEHPEWGLATQIGTPIVALLLYYGSYCFSVKMFGRGEWDDD